MTRLLQTSLVGVLILIASESFGICDNKFDLDCIGQITTTFGDHLRIKVDLGALPIASVGLINMSLENRTEAPVTLGKFRSGCKCLEIEAPTEPIEPGSSAFIKIRLKTPDRPKQVEQFANYTLSSDPKQLRGNVELQIAYRIAGLVAFRDSIAAITAKKGDRQIRFSLPLVIDRDAHLNDRDIVVTLPAQFSKVKTEIVDENGQRKLNVTIDSKELESDLVSGEIKIQNTKSEFSDTITCILKLAEPLQISPNPIRIAKSSKGVYEGSAFVKISEPREDSAKAFTEEITIKANLNGATVKTSTKSFNRGVARLTFEITPIDDKSFNPEIDPDGIFLSLNYKGVTINTKVALKRVSN